MTKEQRIHALNLMWEGQEFGQFLMEIAVTPRERSIAAALKDACWALYQILDDDRRREKNIESTCRSDICGSPQECTTNQHQAGLVGPRPQEADAEDIPSRG